MVKYRLKVHFWNFFCPCSISFWPFYAFFVVVYALVFAVSSAALHGGMYTGHIVSWRAGGLSRRLVCGGLWGIWCCSCGSFSLGGLWSVFPHLWLEKGIDSYWAETTARDWVSSHPSPSTSAGLCYISTFTTASQGGTSIYFVDICCCSKHQPSIRKSLSCIQPSAICCCFVRAPHPRIYDFSHSVGLGECSGFFFPLRIFSKSTLKFTDVAEPSRRHNSCGY